MASGFCACRDCPDIASPENVSSPVLCNECEETGCRNWNSQVGQEHHSSFDCQRWDTYAFTETEN